MTAQGDAERPWPRISGARRYVPVVLVVVGLIVAGLVATLEARSGTQPVSGVATGAHTTVPPTYATAKREGRTADYHWPAGCDRATGRLRMPAANAPPCVPASTGSNGGSTSPGVSPTSITVVDYQAQPGGLDSVVNGATGTPAANLATARAFVELLNKTVELYGRHVNLVPYQASGSASDPVAAQADAVRVAQQLHAFASIGGPAQTSAYEEELARLHVLCIGCAASATASQYEQNAPYLWGTAPTPNTLLNSAVSYIISQLNGKPAQWAGNPAWHHRKRSFAVVNSTQNPPSAGATALSTELQARLKKAHVEFRRSRTPSPTSWISPRCPNRRQPSRRN